MLDIGRFLQLYGDLRLHDYMITKESSVLKGKATWIPGDVVDEIKEHIQEGDTSLVPALRRALNIPFPHTNLIENRNPRKYDVSDLLVGESKTIPWIENSDNQHPIKNSIIRYSENVGRTFEREATPYGLKVTRIY